MSNPCVVLDGGPDGGILNGDLTVQSGESVTFDSGSDLTINTSFSMGTSYNFTTGPLSAVSMTTANLSTGAMSSGAASFSGNVTMAAGINMVLNSTTGTQFGTVSTQKWSFGGATATSSYALYTTLVDTTNPVSSSSWGFTTSSQASKLLATVQDIVDFLTSKGFAH